MAYYLIDLGVVEGLKTSSTYPVLALSLTYNGVTQKETLTLQGEGYWADATGDVSIEIDPENEHVTIYNNWGEPDVGHEYGVEISCSELSESFTDSTQKVIEKGIETLINSMTIEDDTNPTVVNALFFDQNGSNLNDGLFAYVVKGGGESAIMSGETSTFNPPSHNWNIVYRREDQTLTFTPYSITVPFTLELYKANVCYVPASFGALDESGLYNTTGLPLVPQIYGYRNVLIGSDELYGEKSESWKLASVGSIRLTQMPYLIKKGHSPITVPANSFKKVQIDNETQAGYQYLSIPYVDYQKDIMVFPCFDINSSTSAVVNVVIFNFSDSSVTVTDSEVEYRAGFWAYGNSETLKPVADISRLPYSD